MIWVALFLVYQQLQDRVIQPIFYKSAVRIHPALAVLVVLAGAQLAGILGALLAIPTAASLGRDLRRDLAAARRRSGADEPAEPERGARGRRVRPGGPVALAARRACARRGRSAAPRASAASPAGTRRHDARRPEDQRGRAPTRASPSPR